MFDQQIDLTQLPVAPTIHWLEAFALHLRRTPTNKRRERSQLTLEAYLRDVRLFAEYFMQVNGQEFSADQLNTTDLKNWLSNEIKPATHNRRLASMRMLIAWSRQMGIIDYDPAEWIPFMDATRESPRDLSEAERDALVIVAESGSHLKTWNRFYQLRDLLFFRLLDGAGLRISEAIDCKRSDVHLDEGYIDVLGKGKKHRKVRIGGRLVEAIASFLDLMPVSVEGTLITDEHGHAIDRNAAWRRFVMMAETAGVNATPHACRHTYIYRFMDAVMNGDKGRLPAAIDAVCQQSGDRPEVILAYYTRARESEIRAAAEVM